MKNIKHICLIEDDHVQVFLMKKYIEKTGLVEHVSAFHNGKVAYDTLKAVIDNGEALPELIFLDINMPVWDGWEFMKEVIKLPVMDAVTIYILTSSLSPDDFEMAEKYGLKHKYLKKPLSFGELKNILESY